MYFLSSHFPFYHTTLFILKKIRLTITCFAPISPNSSVNDNIPQRRKNIRWYQILAHLLRPNSAPIMWTRLFIFPYLKGQYSYLYFRDALFLSALFETFEYKFQSISVMWRSLNLLSTFLSQPVIFMFSRYTTSQNNIQKYMILVQSIVIFSRLKSAFMLVYNFVWFLFISFSHSRNAMCLVFSFNEQFIHPLPCWWVECCWNPDTHNNKELYLHRYPLDWIYHRRKWGSNIMFRGWESPSRSDKLYNF